MELERVRVLNQMEDWAVGCVTRIKNRKKEGRLGIPVINLTRGVVWREFKQFLI